MFPEIYFSIGGIIFLFCSIVIGYCHISDSTDFDMADVVMGIALSLIVSFFWAFLIPVLIIVGIGFLIASTLIKFRKQKN